MPPMVFGYPRHQDDDVWNNQLCVPDDNLDDLNFFPDFYDGLIRLAGFPLDGEDSWKDFDPERSRSPMTCPNKQENNNLSDEESRDAIPHKQETNSSDENSRDALFPYERELESRKNPIISVRKSCLSVKRRVCSHCQAEKTPQWREGPNGPKTLCNACGVRYKSGRLVPEYRPAASPSFDSRKHSNFHKRIVRKKL